MRYKFRDGFHKKKGLVAYKVAKELEAIRARRGMITAEIVVDEARKKGSPLHNAFEWNDSDAAAQYRLMQARQLIKSIEVVINEKEQVARPQYLITRREDVQQYAPVEVVVGNDDMYEFTMKKVQALLESASRTLETLQHMRAMDEKRKRKVSRLSKAIDSATKVAGRV